MIFVKVFLLLFSNHHFLSFTTNLGGILRSSCSDIIRMVVLNFLPKSSSEGLYPFSKGIEWYDIRATYGLLLFTNKIFKVPTAPSANPFPWWYCGLLVICAKPYSLAKLLKWHGRLHTVRHYLILETLALHDRQIGFSCG